MPELEQKFEKKEEVKTNHKFDKERCRHTNMGFQSVLHCHHYMTLTTQMAEDADFLNGTDVLITTMEDVIYKVLENYYKENNINSLDEKISVAEEYFSIAGLGKINFGHVGEFSATVKQTHSHIDEGWIKKWSKRNKSVNYIGRGFVQACVALFNNKPPRSYESEETKSIVSGADYGEMRIWLK